MEGRSHCSSFPVWPSFAEGPHSSRITAAIIFFDRGLAVRAVTATSRPGQARRQAAASAPRRPRYRARATRAGPLVDSLVDEPPPPQRQPWAATASQKVVAVKRSPAMATNKGTHRKFSAVDRDAHHGCVGRIRWYQPSCGREARLCQGCPKGQSVAMVARQARRAGRGHSRLVKGQGLTLQHLSPSRDPFHRAAQCQPALHGPGVGRSPLGRSSHEWDLQPLTCGKHPPECLEECPP